MRTGETRPLPGGFQRPKKLPVWTCSLILAALTCGLPGEAGPPCNTDSSLPHGGNPPVARGASPGPGGIPGDLVRRAPIKGDDARFPVEPPRASENGSGVPACVTFLAPSIRGSGSEAVIVIHAHLDP